MLQHVGIGNLEIEIVGTTMLVWFEAHTVVGAGHGGGVPKVWTPNLMLNFRAKR